MFALCQALPGPGSTKMLYAINVIRGGFLAGIASFMIWRFVNDFILSSSVNVDYQKFAWRTWRLRAWSGCLQIGDTLPAPVYALLSGLNGATVGIIALAAVQLSSKAITDKVTMVLVFLGGTSGMLYNALWYYPVLMFGGGCTTIIWDYGWGHRLVRAMKDRTFRRRETQTSDDEGHTAVEMQNIQQPQADPSKAAATRRTTSSTAEQAGHDIDNAEEIPSVEEAQERTTPPTQRRPLFSWRFGIIIIFSFFAIFITIMTLRGTLHHPPRGFSLFANLYLAGTIIFGGGPVVIPLLREYVVAEGWVSARDFLLGLAIIQAFPGPNFNFAVYLGTLAVGNPSRLNPAAGATIGYIAIFAPGLILHTGAMGIWNLLRRHRWATSGIRGINAVAVGLIYTAVYRLWEIGYVGAGFKAGSPLGGDPWWVVVTATSFVGGRWFRVPAPAAILLGGVMGMVWYGVVSS